MNRIPTPHIAAGKEDIADTVLMPGDPMRSKWNAENFLESPRLVNNIRGVQGYTGIYRGVPVTVMASGVGIPSISIYAYELYNFYGTARIIRTGTAGSIQPNVNVRDIIISDIAYTNSSFLDQFDLPEDYLPKADPDLVKKAAEIAEKEGYTGPASGKTLHIGPVLTEEIYYSSEKDIIPKWQRKGILAFEMEAAALFANADQAGKSALAVFTVSNHILEGTEMDPAERETNLTEMVNIALKAAVE